MTNGFETSGQQNILLVGINSVEREHISSLLTHDGYTPQHSTFTWFRDNQMSDVPRLIIVDTQRRGSKVIDAVRNKLSDKLSNETKSAPPILAIVDTCLRHKEEIFNYGAADYVSCPLIMAEFSYRVEHAIHSFEQRAVISTSHSAQKNADHVEISAEHNNWSINNEHVLAIKIANYLKSMVGAKVSLNELAASMATNRNKVSRAFKNYYGMTVFDWLREQRMMRAAEMLRFTRDTVQQIADKSGYSDSNNFSTAFKRTFRLSPLQYRKVQQTKNIVHGSKET
ncbi:MAG: AraC-like DNA-binding protein/AmiR/NasT family two-component response regulator [Arenicella sp.]|jgi:AraC-like DNA-binding protein